MKRYFCTLFDKNYLIKGLTMILSLKKFCKTSIIFVLCLDKETKSILEKININSVICLNLEEVENKELKIAKKNRTQAEYCWTLASSFTWYVLNKYKQIELLTYLDADLLFYSDPDPIFREINNSSIAIIEHRFAPEFKELEINGRFCVEWNSFRRDKEGIKCLNKWRKQCLNWCFYKLEDGKMGDQKYLDEWPDLYSSCHIINNLGAGIAPWNYSRYKISKMDNNIKINDENLIFYHFHQFKINSEKSFFRLGDIYTSNAKEPNNIYNEYEKEIKNTLKIIREIDPLFNYGIGFDNDLFLIKLLKKYLPRKIKNKIKQFV